MFQCLKTELTPREKEERRQDKIRSLRERIRKSREIIDKETTKWCRYEIELHELTENDDDEICKPQETGCGGMCSGCE